MPNPNHILAIAVTTLAALSPISNASNKEAKRHAPVGMKLVWNDEFERDGAPDPQKWDFERGFVRNEEAQWYQSDNAQVKDGKLIIEARREHLPNPNHKAGSNNWRTNREFIDYSSASLSTHSKGSWTYGHFEMRARIDTDSGLWPAFWTVGENGEWPDGGEIDIMEFYRGKVLANIAWGTSKRWNAKWNSKSKPITDFGDPDWSKKFHVWTMDWDENRITLAVDGVVLNTQDLSQTVNGNDEHKTPFHAPQFIILNLAVAGQNGGDPAATTFPRRYEIDYVRVYQKK